MAPVYLTYLVDLCFDASSCNTLLSRNEIYIEM